MRTNANRVRAKRLLGAACLALLVIVSLFMVGAAARGPRAEGPGAASAAAPPDAPARHYICPPCGLPCDNVVYDKSGICPKCGMALIDQEAAAAGPRATKKVAILIFDGVQIIDFTGPYEVFGAAGFDVYTVAETKEPVTTVMGMKVVPKYAFADAPQPAVLVVPGGGVHGARESAATLKWITDVTAHAEHTLSVCNGAFILASAGLLDGLTATTTSGLIEKLRAEYPKTRVVDDRRFVDNGKIITAAGLSSRIDGALHVVSRMLGNGPAQAVALSEEYDWRPRSGFARAALADRLIPDVGLDAIGKWKIVSTEGGTDRWEIVVRGSSDLAAAEVLQRLGGSLETNGKWTSVKATAVRSSDLSSRWQFRGRDGQGWTGTLRVQPVAGENHQYNATLAIARADSRTASTRSTR
jgi:putative intracellular protease/amidase